MNPIAKSEDDLLNMVLRNNGTVTGIVTPEVAGWLLRLNTGNRALSEAAVREFEGILARGDWMNTGEPVIVSREGVLNDGQHRLEAIFRSCRAAEMDVRFGVARAAFTSTGIGRKRSAGDVVGMAGIPNSVSVAAAARLVDAYYRNAVVRPDLQRLTPAQTLRAIEAHPLTCEVVSAMRSKRRIKAINTAPFQAAIVVAAETTDLNSALRFAELVDSGETDRGDGARELRERFVREAQDRAKLPAADRMILVIKAWNAWITGRDVQQLKVVETDRTAQYFPKILGRDKKPRFRVAAA